MNDVLGELSLLAQQMKNSLATIELIEENLKKEKERLRRLREEDVPALMKELQLEQIKLDTGEKITVKGEVYASIPKKYEKQAYQWLVEHDFGGLIKSSVVAVFSREEYDEAQALDKKLNSEGYEASFKESVAPQTLKAWLREQLSEGVNVPLDLFGARQVTIATIK